MLSIPLNNLYNYIESVAKEIKRDIIIYRFWPHGSKKVENLKELKPSGLWQDKVRTVNITCHDQEPLNYALRTDDDYDYTNSFIKILKSVSLLDHTIHNLTKSTSVYNKICLLHSEKRSDHVLEYQNNNCVPVYYWSHALIALDWFRFARHVQQKKQIQKTFLIYNRAWSGTREYRLYFAELLIKLNLQNHCQIGVNSVEPELGIHYKTYQFENSTWRPQTQLEDYFPINTAKSYYSADFDIKDYETTDIEVVLETLFDDSRLHLTEKSLRPMACAQPFILAGTCGSLEYLRSYGFKTFGHVWDERYDMIEDPQKRLHAIGDLMAQIAKWDRSTRERKMAQAQDIADYNKKHFFSKEFFNQITTELKTNLEKGINEITSDRNFQPFIDRWQHRLTVKEISDFLKKPDPGFPTIDQVNCLLDTLKNLQ